MQINIVNTESILHDITQIFSYFSYLFIFLSIPLCTFKFFSISHKHHNEAHTEANTEEEDVSSLSLSNSTTNDVDVQNSTIENIDTSKGNDEKLKLKTNNTENLKEICSNQCSCDICKDSISENLSTLTESRLDSSPNQENANQSSKSQSVPTFGKYYNVAV